MEMENEILRALAFASVQFSSETQLFIVARRTSHQQELEFSASNSSFEFADGTSVPHTGSKFYTREELKQTTEYHSQMALATFGRQSNLGM